jgi:colicin import membrane protein
MALIDSRRNAGIGISFFLSAFLHLAVFLLLLSWNNLFPVSMTPKATYYVDIVNLPVASPRQGSSSQKMAVPPIVPPPQPASISRMALPPSTTKNTKPAPSATGKTASDADDFDKRMSKLQNVAESRQQEDNIERMRRKFNHEASEKTGASAGVGTQAGSDYLSYITSRLSDVFSEPPNTAKQVFAEVKIRINAAGKLELMEITKSSGNPAFDNYAKRSVYEAEKDFPPPPKGKFEFTFRFRPQGVTRK